MVAKINGLHWVKLFFFNFLYNLNFFKSSKSMPRIKYIVGLSYGGQKTIKKYKNEYVKKLKKYHEVLKKRNTILKIDSKKPSDEYFEIITKELNTLM